NPAADRLLLGRRNLSLAIERHFAIVDQFHEPARGRLFGDNNLPRFATSPDPFRRAQIQVALLGFGVVASQAVAFEDRQDVRAERGLRRGCWWVFGGGRLDRRCPSAQRDRRYQEAEK